MHFSEHQRGLWLSMIGLLSGYLDDTETLPGLVGKLEAALDAGEPWDERLLREWYDHLIPLEEEAVSQDIQSPRRAKELARLMIGFLREYGS